MSHNVLYILREVEFCPRPCEEVVVSGDLHCQESCHVPVPWLAFAGLLNTGGGSSPDSPIGRALCLWLSEPPSSQPPQGAAR